MDDHERHRYLTVYLNDHLAGATVGKARFARAARAHRGSEVGRVLDRLHQEIAEDRRALLRCLHALDVPRRVPMEVAGRVGEALGALKPNGRIVRTSPLRTVIELEGLGLAVQGKAAGWRSLLELARTDQRLDTGLLQELLQRAEVQGQELERLRRTAVRDVLSR